MTEAEAEQAITMALAVLPQHARSLDAAAISATAKGWAWILDDIESRDVLGALKRHLATSKWLPTPAEIRTIVDEAAHGRRRNGGDAWGDVRREIGRAGRYRAPRFDDAITALAVSRLGWVELCDSENAVADRARFIELYDRLAATSRREEQSPMLGDATAVRSLQDRQGANGIVLQLADKIGAKL